MRRDTYVIVEFVKAFNKRLNLPIDNYEISNTLMYKSKKIHEVIDPKCIGQIGVTYRNLVQLDGRLIAFITRNYSCSTDHFGKREHFVDVDYDSLTWMECKIEDGVMKYVCIKTTEDEVEKTAKEPLGKIIDWGNLPGGDKVEKVFESGRSFHG